MMVSAQPVCTLWYLQSLIHNLQGRHALLLFNIQLSEVGTTNVAKESVGLLE